jgi:hypothetical protein
MKRCAITLLVIPVAMVVADCSPRQQDYGWDQAPRTDAGGLEVTVREVSQSRGQVQATLYVRDLTDKDCLLEPVQPGAGSSWMTASWGQERIQGTVRLVAIATPQDGQAFQRTFDPQSGPCHVQAHSSRIMVAEFTLSAFSDEAGPWTIHVAGHWSQGAPVDLDIAVPAMTTNHPNPDGVPVYVSE